MADAPADRAEAELRVNAARSNRLIAELIDCDHHVVARVRTRLERTAAIARVPGGTRTPRYPNGPRQLGRAQQAVRDLGPLCTTRQVMELAQVGRCAAWKARTHPRAIYNVVADAAAAVDALSVVRTTPKRTGKAYPAGSALPQGFYRPPDEIELACPACTLAWRDGGWQHDRACPLKRLASVQDVRR